jgi:hypothetical protein
VEGGSRTVRGEWPVAVVRIQCFSFGSGGEGRQRDETLSEDEADAANLSWVHRKEA